MHEIASQLLTETDVERMVDVPLSLQHGKYHFPLGRYLRRKLRLMVGKDEKTPEAILQIQRENMHAMLKGNWHHSVPLKTKLVFATEGKRQRIEAKAKRNRKNTL